MRAFSKVLSGMVGILAAALLYGCHDDLSGFGAPDEGSPEAVALLRAMSYPGTSLGVLAVEGGVPTSRAAQVIAWRDGADGRPGTVDDRRFRSLDELTAAAGFGGAELTRLGSWALARGWDDGDEAWVGTFDGVGFTVFDAEVTLDVANQAAPEVLDLAAGLRADAVRNIVAGRPFGSVSELAALPRVGPTNLGQLRAYAVAEAERAAILAAQ